MTGFRHDIRIALLLAAIVAGLMVQERQDDRLAEECRGCIEAVRLG